ncbi:hypothetical protein [Streptomyces sp. NBC_01185]|uniref:hypothetical protein n=1 Tax=Streptomyces sp. NBC_01185 TaxID=2903764 RepID=UPI003867C08F|nr:hypothetical protein OG770_27160 [Streptomyces sp. NBC_01185]
MSRNLLRALALALLIAECVAQFIAHSQTWANVFFLLALAAIAVRWARGPQTDDERACPADCPKCAEDGETA